MGAAAEAAAGGETLVEKVEQIQGLVQEFRLASSMSRLKIASSQFVCDRTPV